MEFFSLQNAPIKNDDVIFREAWLTKLLGLIVWTALTCVGGALAWLQRSWWIGLFPLLCFLLVLATLSALRHALSSSNWLLRRQPDGLLINYRSYLHGGSKDEEVVVHFDYDELEYAGKTVQRRMQRSVDPSAPTAPNSVAGFNLTFLDLEMKHANLQPLSSRLRNERGRRAITRGMNRVTVENRVIRLLWRGAGSHIKQSPKLALAYISATGQVRVRPDKKEQLDVVTDPETRTKREAAIRQLVEAGNRLGAIDLAKTYHDCSMAEASSIVDGIVMQPVGYEGDSPLS